MLTLMLIRYRNLKNVRDMVLFRFGSTGVHSTLVKAAELLDIVPLFPVENARNLEFRDVILVRNGSTIEEAARRIFGEIKVSSAEGIRGPLSMNDTISHGYNDILSFKLNQ